MRKARIMPCLLALTMLVGCKGNSSVSESSPTAIDGTSVSATGSQTDISGTAQVTKPITTTAPKPEVILGCGGPKPDTENECYYDTFIFMERDANGVPISIEHITSQTLCDKVLKWFQESNKVLQEKRKTLEQLCEHNPNIPKDGIELIANINLQNGYLIPFLGLAYTDHSYDEFSESMGGYFDFYSMCTYFDCETEQELTMQEIFYDGVDYMAAINHTIQAAMERPMNMNGFEAVTLPMKRPFAGLTEFSFDGSGIRIPYGNPYLTAGVAYSNYELGDEWKYFLYENCKLWHQRKVEGIYDGDMEYSSALYEETEGKGKFTFGSDGVIGNVQLYKIVVDSEYWTQAQIDQARALCDDFLNDAQTASLFEEYMGYSITKEPFTEDGWLHASFLNMETYLKQKVLVLHLLMGNEADVSPEIASAAYDLDTLEPISNTELLKRFLGDDYREMELEQRVLTDEKINALPLLSVTSYGFDYSGVWRTNSSIYLRNQEKPEWALYSYGNNDF